MRDELVELAERARVGEQLDALARRQLALGVLRSDARRAATAERGRAIGLNDSFGGSMTVLTAVITGPLIEFYGLPSAGLTAIILACIPFFLLAAFMLRNGGRMP